MSLKFENVASVGDRIRAYDFKPMSDRAECYIEGLVKDKGFFPEYGFSGYRVAVQSDTLYEEDARTEVFVPFELSMMDYDARIMKLEG